MKLIKLQAPRSVVLHNDDALTGACTKPGPEPTPGDFPDEAAFAAAKQEHAEAVARFAAWERYLDGFDISALPLRPGARPVIFMIRRLTPEQLAAVVESEGLFTKFARACAYGVTEIKNLEVQDERGASLGMFRAGHATDELGDRLDEQAMQVFLDPEVVAEVGSQVLFLARNGLARGLRKSD